MSSCLLWTNVPSSMRSIFWITSCPWTVWRSWWKTFATWDSWPRNYSMPPMTSMMKSVMSFHIDLPNIVLPKVIRKPKEICFVRSNCVVCGGFCVYNLESTPCFSVRSLLYSEKSKTGLTGFIKDRVCVFQHFWMHFRKKQFFGSYLKEF